MSKETKVERKNSSIYFFGTVWLMIVFIGIGILIQYENRPGNAGNPPKKWPIKSIMIPAMNTSTLVLFVHPHCPCTSATVGELELLLTQCRKKIKTYIVFFKPEEFTNEWIKTNIWKNASSISGVKLIVDENGNEANLFKVSTSGQTLLYSNQGKLLFNGGITGSRGHSGDNAGRNSILSLLKDGKTNKPKTFVFGCSLYKGSTPIAKRK